MKSQKSKVQFKIKPFTFHILPLTSRGFTLIELIIYIALVSIFISGAIFFSWDVIYAREKGASQQTVEQNARAILARIMYEIRRARNIISVTSDQIVLDNGGSSTTIMLSSSVVTIAFGGGGSYNLSSNQVLVLDQPSVPDPLFTNLSSGNNNTKNVKISITVQQAQTTQSSVYQAQTTVTSSEELKGQFNDAALLSANASNATLANNERDLVGITLQNLGATNIDIDRIKVSWTGAPPASRLSNIEINGSSVWTGNATSGATVDIANVTLTPGAISTPINRFDFSRNMSNAVFIIEFIMTDGSSTKVAVDFS